jgi:outer membrane protein
MSRQVTIQAFILTLVLIYPPFLWAQEDKETYSLTDLYRIALKRSESIKIAEEDLFIAEKTKDKAKSVLIPKLSAFGGYTRFSEREIVIGRVIQPEWGSQWGLNVGQSFTLNGKELIAYRMTQKNIEKFRHDLHASKESFLFKVAQDYYSVIRAMENKQIAEANVKRLTKHRDAVVVRLKLGDLTKTALYRAEAELSSSRSLLISAVNNEKLARATLATSLEIPANINVSHPKFDESRFRYDSLEVLKKEALIDRAEMKSIEVEKSISKDQIRLTKSDYWPTISWEGNYSKFDQHPEELIFNDKSLSIGLKLDFLIYDGGLRRADVKETLSKNRQVELQREALEKQISIEVEEAYLFFVNQKSILDSLADQLKFARENYDAVIQQFEHGLANSVDVMDANTLLVTSEVELSDARYGYQLSVLGIERAKGAFLNGIKNDL